MAIEINGADEATVGPIREALKAPRKSLTIQSASGVLSIDDSEVQWDLAAARMATLDVTESCELFLASPPIGAFYLLATTAESSGYVLTLPDAIWTPALQAAWDTVGGLEGVVLYEFRRFSADVLTIDVTTGLAPPS